MEPDETKKRESLATLRELNDGLHKSSENMKARIEDYAKLHATRRSMNSFQEIATRKPQTQRAFATASEAQLWQEHIKRRLVQLAKPLPDAPKGKLYHRFFATGLGASMWFYLMYRAKQDGAVLLGWRHPWEH